MSEIDWNSKRCNNIEFWLFFDASQTMGYAGKSRWMTPYFFSFKWYTRVVFWKVRVACIWNLLISISKDGLFHKMLLMGFLTGWCDLMTSEHCFTHPDTHTHPRCHKIIASITQLMTLTLIGLYQYSFRSTATYLNFKFINKLFSEVCKRHTNTDTQTHISLHRRTRTILIIVTLYLLWYFKTITLFEKIQAGTTYACQLWMSRIFQRHESTVDVRCFTMNINH